MFPDFFQKVNHEFHLFFTYYIKNFVAHMLPCIDISPYGHGQSASDTAEAIRQAVGAGTLRRSAR